MTTTSESTVGIAEAELTEWFARTVPAAAAPLSFEQIAGGRSNLTYLVTDSTGRKWVLRRPPLGKIVATAHDVVREADVLARLAGSGVPVPAISGVSADDQVNGAPFFVMEHLPGTILRDAADVEAFAPADARRDIGLGLIDVLARLHTVSPADVGWADRAMQRGYIDRQLTRWSTNWERDRVRVLEDIARTRDALAGKIPAQHRAAVVHGDFRLDNCLIGPDHQVVGVLDWELATVGDPLADLGQFLVYWAEPGDEVTALETPPTLAAGLPTRAELTRRYLDAVDLPAADIDYYVAFNWWKTACIVEGVYTRMSRGSMGRSDRTPESFGAQAERLAAQAWACAQALS